MADLTNRDIRRIKQALEQRLARSLAAEIVQFHAETGEHVVSITVSIVSHRTATGGEVVCDLSMVTDVEVKLGDL